MGPKNLQTFGCGHMCLGVGWDLGAFTCHMGWGVGDHGLLSFVFSLGSLCLFLIILLAASSVCNSPTKLNATLQLSYKPTLSMNLLPTRSGFRNARSLISPLNLTNSTPLFFNDFAAKAN